VAESEHAIASETRKSVVWGNKQEECELRRTLLQDYEAAAKRYASAVAELNQQGPVFPPGHYQDAYNRVEHAREECERLRRILFELGD
jgi:hypothetical protein